MSAFPIVLEPETFVQKLGAEAMQNTCIVDLSDAQNFHHAHIPGAVHLPYTMLVSGHAPAPGKLPDTERLQALLRYLGHRPNTHYIVCDDEGGGWAGRFIWTLDILGHTAYSYLNGGMLAWRALNFPTVSGNSLPSPLPEDQASADIKLNCTPRIELDELLQTLSGNTVQIWDARSPEEFMGSRINAMKAGHIPGAINLEWTRLMNASRHYKIHENAADIVRQAGLDLSKPTVTHCQSHHRSGFTYLVGKVLHMDMRGYDGSWSEWGNHPNTPVER